MNFVFGFRVADRHDGCAQKASGVEALFAVVIAGIFHRESRPVENLLGIREIKPMLFLLLLRLDSHHEKFMAVNYTYEYMYSSHATNRTVARARTAINT